MKPLIKSIRICLESILDDDDIFLDPENDKKVIENWIRDNYRFSSKLTISDDLVVDCTGFAEVKNKSITSLTNGMFRWGKVGGDFYCNSCKNLKTLEGAPEKVGQDFGCSDCKSLTSLKGAPKEVRGSFWCEDCDNLKSLNGAPKKVGGSFYCENCPKLKITDSEREKYKIED